MDVRSALWWPLYLGLLVLNAELFGEGGLLQLPQTGQLLVLAGMALGVMPLAVFSALPEESPHAQLEGTSTSRS